MKLQFDPYVFDPYVLIPFDDWCDSRLEHDFQRKKNEVMRYYHEHLRDLQTNFAMERAKFSQDLYLELNEIETERLLRRTHHEGY